MRGVQATAIWTSGLCALAGAGFITAFLTGGKPQPHILAAAALAATIGLVSLLIGVLIVQLLAGRRFESGMHLMQLGFPGDAPAERDAARFQARLRTLETRLDIDEPRLCSQYMIACTCWSFCERSPRRDYISAGTPSETDQLRNLQVADAEQGGLPIVCRTGRDDCPFRFASPATQPGRSERGLPSESGCACP